jgi:predicted neutral ceramidase superfamily lipid hydrolase
MQEEERGEILEAIKQDLRAAKEEAKAAEVTAAATRVYTEVTEAAGIQGIEHALNTY